MKTIPASNAAILTLTLALMSCTGTDSGAPGGTGGASNISVGGAGGDSAVGGASSSGGGTKATGGGVGAGGVSTGGGPMSGGVSPTGGTTSGSIATGGANATGGSVGAGGSAVTGGSKSAGGTATTGGSKASGGGVATGGVKTTGGGVATGGINATGGGVSTGGVAPTGGSKATGGFAPTGGTKSTGGANPTGGSKATGGAAATGGTTAASTSSCTLSGSISSSSGELTCYYFGQGTAQGVCMGSTTYKTNCGYCGTEGSSSGNACNTSHNDKVANISTGSYYVAIPNWGSGSNCGLCVSITRGSTTIVATVVDNCASCGSAGHIDLSPSAGVALNMGTGSGQTEDVTSGVTWKAVSCPVGTASIVAVYNGAYAGQVYFQNVAFPIASASAVVSGTTHTATLSNGFWDFGTTLSSGTQITLKDTAGHTVTGTLGANGAGIGVQFPTTC